MDIIANDRYSTTSEMLVLPIIRQVCRARPEGFFHMPKYKSGVWDGYISLMKGFKEFPTGLLSIVLEAIEKSGWNVNVISNAKILDSKEVVEDSLHDITLRDYQIEAANTLVKQCRGIAKMATNAGKTEIMAAVIWSLGMPHTTILVHRKELMYQTARRLEKRLGCRVGIYGAGVKSQRDITVAMIQTLSKDKSYDYSKNEVVIVDECHHLSSNQMMDIIFKIPGSYRYGFSGTPLKNDVLSDMKLMAATGEILYETSNKFLIKSGYSAVPKIHIHVVESYDRDEWQFEYMDAYDKLLVNNQARNKIIASVARKAGGVVLVLVNRIDHGKMLQGMIPNSVFVSGDDEVSYRNSALDNMRNNGSCVYIATPIYDEGIDVPAVDTIILAGGGKSYVKLLQRVGRGLRKKDGNNVLMVHDFLDDTNMFLFEHSEERISTYREQEFEVSIDK